MQDSSNKSVSEWIADWTAGDQQAAQKLWERYYQRLVGQARRLLNGRLRRVADEEDVASAI